jgi:hypothetical protein
MRRRPAVPAAVLILAAWSAACGRACRDTQPPPGQAQIPTLKGPDGREYVLLARGSHKPHFDAQNLLERVEYDRNGDGKPDQVARHNGKRVPELVEDDDDFDGAADRWIYYNQAGALIKVGGTRKGGKPDFWVYQGPDGKPSRQEYDDDGDGRPDRAELLKDGRVTAVEVDADRDGKPDRWQHWEAGRLASEDLDTDNDGKPDRRLRYDAKGAVVGVDPLPAPAATK